MQLLRSCAPLHAPALVACTLSKQRHTVSWPCRRKAQAHAHSEASGGDAEGKPLLPLGGTHVDVEASSVNGAPGSPAPAELGKPSYAWTSSAFYRCLMLDEEALLSCRDALRSAVEFGTILAWFYVADRTSLIAPGTKVGGCCMAGGTRCGPPGMAPTCLFDGGCWLPAQQRLPATAQPSSWCGRRESLMTA